MRAHVATPRPVFEEPGAALSLRLNYATLSHSVSAYGRLHVYFLYLQIHFLSVMYRMIL